MLKLGTMCDAELLTAQTAAVEYQAEDAFILKLNPLLTGEAIQPSPLLTGMAELLGLTLNGEIQQQGAQLQHLRAADRHAADAMAAAEAFLLLTPFPDCRWY